MAANNHTHSFANITPVNVTLYTIKRDGPHGHALATFDCTGPRNKTGAMGHYRFTIRLTPYQVQKLAVETADIDQRTVDRHAADIIAKAAMRL